MLVEQKHITRTNILSRKKEQQQQQKKDFQKNTPQLIWILPRSKKMNLREYLFRKEMKVVDFAKYAGLSVSYLSNLKNQRSRNYRYPSLAVRKLIQFATEGEVHFMDDWPTERRKD
jgi:hypothetical protein